MLVSGAAESGLDARKAEELQHHLDANEELASGYRWLELVMWFHRLGALAYGIVTVVAIGALGDTRVPVGPGIVVVVLATALTAILAIGAIQILFQPFLWTVLVAVLASIVSYVHLVGPNPMGLAFYLSAGCATLFWSATFPAWRVRTLIHEYKDLYILHHASRKTRKSVHHQPEEAKHAQLDGAMQRANRRAWKIAGTSVAGLLVVSGVGSYAVYAKVRPPALEPSVASFEGAWNRGDLEAVAALFPRDAVAHQTEWLRNVALGNGWTSETPVFEHGEWLEDDGSARVTYTANGREVVVRWARVDRVWRLIEVGLPNPPLEPLLARFRAAWSTSSAPAVSAFFQEPFRERMTASIESSTSLRGWDTYPDLPAPVCSEDDDGYQIAAFAIESGDVVTKWTFRADGTWGLHGLQFPKR